MIPPDEALRIVLDHTPRLEAVEVPLIDAVGACLAEPVAGDLDLPPFDKSAMDGYAVRAADVARAGGVDGGGGTPRGGRAEPRRLSPALARRS